MSLTRFITVLCTFFIFALALTGCKPDFPNCRNDDHCAQSDEGMETGRTYCINNVCQQCRGDGDCSQGQECVAGSCEDIPGYCVGTDDCPGNQVCRENSCGPECLSNADCTGDMECQGGTCVEPPECTSNADCADGQRCRNNECEEIPVALCDLNQVFFEFNSSQLDSTARSVLQANADCIRERNLTVRIEGHCDERGTAEFNLALGNRRANAVQNYLVSLGVPRNLLSTVSYGDQQLVRSCGEQGPESCHRVNRRAHFQIR